MSLRNKPYANHITTLNVWKNDKLNGINSTLLVRITCAYKKERKVKCLRVVFLKEKMRVSKPLEFKCFNYFTYHNS